MDQPVKFSDLSPSQQKEVKRIGARFLRKSLLRGLSGFITLFLINIVISIANAVFFQSQGFLILGSVGAALFVVHSLSKGNLEEVGKMREEIKKAIETKES